MKRFTILLFSVLIASVFTACKKDPAQVSGTNSVVFEADEFQDLMTNFSGLVNTAKLSVNDAKPYELMIGNVVSSAMKATINGNGTEISNIEITNIRVSTIELYSPWDINTLDTYLQDAELNLEYLNSSATIIKMELGEYSNVNLSSKNVEFTPTAADLTSFMANNPDRLRFDLQFNGQPLSSMEVKYRIVFDYAYSYDERERK